MTPRTNDDVATVARNYIDKALELMGGPRPSDEDYERALAKAEDAFRQLAGMRRERARATAGR
jgi:hypothetical protein